MSPEVADRGLSVSKNRLFPLTPGEWAIVAVIFALLTGSFIFAARAVHREVERANCYHRIWQLAYALRRYHYEFGHLPPPVTYDERGRPMHSWRIILWKYLEPERCAAYNFREPWNSPNNRKLALKVPDLFQCPSCANKRQTNYLLIIGSGALFASTKATPHISDITDLPESTILLVESSDSGINWLEPQDLDVSTMAFDLKHDHRPGISGPHREGPAVAFADFEVHRLRPDRIDEELLRKLINASGGDRIERSTFTETLGR